MLVLRPSSSIRVASNHPSSARAITVMFCNFAQRWPGDAAAINFAGKLRQFE
jgi:hypothetical protein